VGAPPWTANANALAGRLADTDTAYALPVTYGLTGLAVQDAEEAPEALQAVWPANPLVCL